MDEIVKGLLSGQFLNSNFMMCASCCLAGRLCLLCRSPVFPRARLVMCDRFLAGSCARVVSGSPQGISRGVSHRRWDRPDFCEKQEPCQSRRCLIAVTRFGDFPCYSMRHCEEKLIQRSQEGAGKLQNCVPTASSLPGPRSTLRPLLAARVAMLLLLVGAPSLALLRLPTAKPRPLHLYTSDVCVAHNPGGQHPEQPARLRNLLRALRTEWKPEFGPRLQICEPAGADVTEEQLLRVHSRDHVQRVDAAFGNWGTEPGAASQDRLGHDRVAGVTSCREASGRTRCRRCRRPFCEERRQDSEPGGAASPCVCDGAAAGSSRGGGGAAGVLPVQQRDGGRGARAGRPRDPARGHPRL